jgi:hypothetical protein
VAAAGPVVCCCRRCCMPRAAGSLAAAVASGFRNSEALHATERSACVGSSVQMPCQHEIHCCLARTNMLLSAYIPKCASTSTRLFSPNHKKRTNGSHIMHAPCEQPALRAALGLPPHLKMCTRTVSARLPATCGGTTSNTHTSSELRRCSSTREPAAWMPGAA